MSHIVLATPEISDAGTLTASTQLAAAPVGNLQRLQPTDVWQSTNTAPYIELDLGSAQSINLIAILFTNCTASATWRIRGANTQPNLTAAPAYDVGPETFSPWTTSADRRHGFKFLQTPISYRWLRIDLADATNPDGFISAGRLYVANAYQPARNYEYGPRFGHLDPSERDRSSGGQTITRVRPLIPVFEFTLVCNSKSEFYANSYRIQQLRGGSKDVLIIRDPDDSADGHEGIYYGLLSGRPESVHPRFNHYEQRYSLEGLI